MEFDPNNIGCLGSPAVCLTQYVGYPTIEAIWTDSLISTSIIGVDSCGSYTTEIMQMISGTPTVLDPDVFHNLNLVHYSRSFGIQTNDFSKAASYVVRMTFYYTDYPLN